MNRLRLAALLIASHALAAAAVWFYLGMFRDAAPAPLTPAEVRARLTAGPSKAAAPADAPANRVVTVVKTNRFHWSQIESGDYRKFIANLRAIGCPEQTIKDLIITDVMKHYAAHRGRLRDNGREFRFWETNDRRTLTAKQLAAREKELAKIDKDVPAVLRELLGVNYERELNRYFLDEREDDKRLAFLSDAKRQQILASRELVEGMREKLLEQIGDGKPTAAQAERLKAIDELSAGLIAQSLSASEAELYELSTSPTADRLRGELVGFAPTEAEFKFMFRLWREHDEKYAFDGPDARADRDTDRRRIEEQIREHLGPARAAEFARAGNPQYRDFVLFAHSHELPGATADTLFEMRTAATDVRAQLLANPQLDPGQRDAALQALQEEVQRSIRATLGADLYETYAKNGGGWLKSLGRAR